MIQCKGRNYLGHEIERVQKNFPIGHGFEAVVRHPRQGFVVASWHSGHGAWGIAAKDSGYYSHANLDVVLQEDIESGYTLAEARRWAGLCPNCGKAKCKTSPEGVGIIG